MWKAMGGGAVCVYRSAVVDWPLVLTYFHFENKMLDRSTVKKNMAFS